jgi:diguanylate cyclase
MLLRSAYVVASLVVIAAYTLLPADGRTAAFLLVSLGAIPAVLVGSRRIAATERRPWSLLLAALIVVNIANVISLLPGAVAATSSELIDAASNALVLAAAVALVVRQGRNNLGVIIDTTIVALALGGLLWDAVIGPHLAAHYRSGVAHVNLFVAVLALCGVLGALVRLVQMEIDPPPALWLLIAALAFGLTGYVLLAVESGPQDPVVATLLFMGVYTALGLFGLDRAATRLARPAPVHREDALSVGRLAFLGIAVAAIPAVTGGRAIAGEHVDGLRLLFASTTIGVLVIVRIGRLWTERDRAEQALRYAAAHDPLTGLVNRREFVGQLGSELSHATGCAILFCDLDGFKAVNDRLGHAAGDELLVDVARRLQTHVREDDLVCRFGGDEFLILLRDTRLSDIELTSERIADGLSRPIVLRGEEVTIGASIGIAVAPGNVGPEELIKRADHAMYVAKSTRRPLPRSAVAAWTKPHCGGEDAHRRSSAQQTSVDRPVC